ncbi:MAG: hypothetical protein Q9216_003024 [Gyalolechia sp. 2 TL-2023]
MYELKEALAIEPGDKDFNLDSVPDIDLVLEACAGLVIVDEETEQVRLVHYTAQDYLDALLTSSFDEAHALLAGDCITYLSYDVFQSAEPEGKAESDSIFGPQSSYPEVESESDSDSTYHLLDYASKFWALHSTSGNRAGLSAQLQDFLSGEPRVRLQVEWSWDPDWEPTLKLPKHLDDTCNGIGIAAYYGLDDALRWLLQHEADLNEKTYHGHSALHLAVMRGSIVAAEILLGHGADIECVSFGGLRPLHVAINHKNERAARMLVERGASVVASGSLDVKPFAMVDWGSPMPFLQLLLSRGADIHSQSYSGETQLTSRARRCDTETVRWLLEEGIQVDNKGEYGYTALHVVAAQETTYTVQLLVEEGTIVNHKSVSNETMFEYVVKRSVELVELLLEWGASVNLGDRQGRRALHDAAKRGSIEMVKLLLRKGALVNLQADRGTTALLDAASQGSTEMVELLIRKGALVNLQDDSGTTALFNAASRDSTEVAELLLDNGADIGIIDQSGYNVLHKACLSGHSVLVKRCLDLGVNVDAAAFYGESPLHLAAKRRHGECLDLLIANHADVNKQDNFGRTPLMSALMRSDRWGWAPQTASIALGKEAFTTAFRRLINAGAIVSLQDRHDLTVLHYAAVEGDVTILRELLNNHADPLRRSRLILTMKVTKGRGPDRSDLDPEIVFEGDRYEFRFYGSRRPQGSSLAGILSERQRLIRDKRLDCRLWRNGMTALDVAIASNNEDCIHFLEPLTGPRTESTVLSFEDFLCKLYGSSSIAELQKETKQQSDDSESKRVTDSENAGSSILEEEQSIHSRPSGVI